MTEEPHVTSAVLKLNFEARTVASPVASGRLFAPDIDFLRTEAKPLRFHKTEGANNHIKQGDTLIFAYNPIGITDNRLPTMLTNAIHGRFKGKEHAMLPSISKFYESIAFQRDFDFQPGNKSAIRSKDEGNFILFRDFCEQFFYKTPLLPLCV